MIKINISEALAAMQEHDNLQSRIKQAKDLKKSLDDLGRGINDALFLIKQLELLTKAPFHFCPSLDPELLNRLRSIIKKCAQDVQDGQIDMAPVNSFWETTGRLTERLKGEWNAFLAPLLRELLESLKILSPFLPDQVTCSKISQVLTELQMKWPLSPSDITRLSQYIEDGRALTDQLNVSKPIRDFLILLVNGNATLADVDKTILEWVKKYNLEGKIRIGFAK